MQNQAPCKSRKFSRRSLLFAGLLALLYPFFTFIGYTVPRKPKKIFVNKPLPLNGVLVNNDYILFDRDNSSWALSRRCTHLGCKINFHEQEDYLECPCHQSRFTVEGNVIKGPAKDSLTVYPVEKKDSEPFYTITT